MGFKRMVGGGSVADHFGKLDPDPDTHQGEKQDPDPDRSPNS